MSKNKKFTKKSRARGQSAWGQVWDICGYFREGLGTLEKPLEVRGEYCGDGRLRPQEDNLGRMSEGKTIGNEPADRTGPRFHGPCRPCKRVGFCSQYDGSCWGMIRSH